MPVPGDVVYLNGEAYEIARILERFSHDIMEIKLDVEIENVATGETAILSLADLNAVAA